MKPTRILFRHIRRYQLTTKQGPKDYYKGTRSGRMGDHTKYGGYIVNYDRVRTYVVPEGLSSFKVRLVFVHVVIKKRIFEIYEEDA